MTVWIVTVTKIDYDDTLFDEFEIAGVFDTEEKARAKQEGLINENAHEVIALECDPVDVIVEEWVVQ